jgi:signal transduction histidine kinase
MADDLANLKERFARLELLYQVSNVIHSTLEPEEALKLILREAIRLTRASSGSVVLINPTNGFLEIQAAEGLPEGAAALKLRVGEGITGWVARAGQAARIGDVVKDRRYVMVHPGVKSELAVPLEVQGEIRGVLNVDSDRKNAFTASDQELLQDLAVPAARVIHHTWLYEQLRLKAGLFESLVSVGQVINSTLNVDDVLKVITRETAQLLSARMSSLLLLDPTRQWLDLRASFGAGQAYIEKPRLSVEESLVGIVVRRKKPLAVENVQISSRYQHVELARGEGLVSLLSVPLVYSGQSIGALNIYTGEPHSFSNEETRIALALAELSALAIERARLYERVVDMEEHLRQSERLSALGLLAAEVAHEIRNPLTVMKMLYHSLNLNFEANDPRNRDASIIGEKMDLLNRIVEQILDFARSTEPLFSSVNINELLEKLTLLTRHKLQNQGISLERCFDPELPLVMADSTHLEQAFLNVTLNAVEAMPEGGQLKIVTRRDRDDVVIEFVDTGHGMSEEQQQRAFASLLKTSKQAGTGLGLALVARVVEAHRGTVRIDSRQGRGTTLRIRLPVRG